MVDVRLPGEMNSTSHGARPVHLIITMMKWIRTSRLSIKNSLSTLNTYRWNRVEHLGHRVEVLGLKASHPSASAIGSQIPPLSGFRVQDLACRVQGAGCRVQAAGCRVQGAGCRVQGAGCRVQGAGFRA